MRQAEVEGIGILEFPDDTPDEVIQKTVKKMVRKRTVDADKARIEQELQDDTKSPFLTAIGRGFMDIGQGAKQLFLGATNPQAEAQYTDKKDAELAQYQKLAEANPIQSFTGRMIGNTAALPIPGGVGATTATRLGTAGLSGALSAGLQYTPEGDSRARNAAIGGIGGLGVQGVIGEPLRRLGSGLASTPAQMTERQAITEAGKKANVPVFTTDVTQNPMARELDTLAEKAGPLGTAPGRLKQAEAAQSAMQDLVATHRGNRQLGDLSDEVRNSLGHKLSQFQKVKKGKYLRAGKIADKAGDIPTSRFDQTIDQSIKEIQSQGIASPELVAKLEAAKAAPRGNFSTLSALEDDLGNEVSSFYGGANSAIPKKGVQYLQRAKESLRADIVDHLQKNQPGALPLIRDADKFYQDNILAFKKTQLSQLVSDKSKFNPEQAWKFVERNADSQMMMKTLYNSLGPNGRVAVKSGLLKEALDSGTVVPQQGGTAVFSPGRTAKYLEDKLALVDQFMSPDEAKEVRGVVKLFRAIQRSGQVSENPPTGARLVLPALVASSFWEPTTAAMVGGGLLTSRMIFQDETTRKMLMALAELPANNPRATRLVSTIANTLRSRIPGALVQPKIEEE